MEMRGQLHHPAALPPGKESWYQLDRDWVVLRAIMDVAENWTLTIQPLSRRYPGLHFSGEEDEEEVTLGI
jgi:hypothetical protein